MKVIAEEKRFRQRPFATKSKDVCSPEAGDRRRGILR